MKRKSENTKTNRIEKCLGELLSRKLSLKFNNSLFIPLDVFRNFIKDNTIDTADKLEEELLKFSRGGYEILHPYPAGVITRDYVLPAIKRINDENRKKGSSYSLTFPCMVESRYSDTSRKEFSGYRFSANRELYAAKRLHQYMQEHYKFFHTKKLSLTLDTFSIFLQSPKQNLKKIIEKQNSAYINLVYDNEQISFTLSHIIPVLNYLNEISNENSDSTRYNMRVCCKKSNKQIPEQKYIREEIANNVTYEITIEEITNEKSTDNTDCPNPTIVLKDPYFNLNTSSTIVYYKMSKWAYLLHVYILNSLHESKISYTETSLQEKQTEYRVIELDANAVWTFWYNSSLTSTSYHSDFVKAVDELNNTVQYTVRSDSSKIRKRWILPNTSCNDKNYNIVRPQKYEITNVSGNHVTCYATYKQLYKIAASPNGKYYVYLHNRDAQMFSFTKGIVKYPKKLIQLSARTSYSQIRLFEFLYNLFNKMITNNNKTVDISISRLAAITGKVDIGDWKINQHFRDIDPTDNNYLNRIYHKVIRTKRFAYDLNRFFLQPNLELFNTYLRTDYKNYNCEYQISIKSNSDNSQISFIQFALVPLNEPNL